ncbi:hypothetical protein DFJ74DRAFT_675550 [Hyaloraphidium curvatum]|nr:hypothetical protein DFJ74DRAFT_675550 [Hyaloraphidium curvatum]
MEGCCPSPPPSPPAELGRSFSPDSPTQPLPSRRVRIGGVVPIPTDAPPLHDTDASTVPLDLPMSPRFLRQEPDSLPYEFYDAMEVPEEEESLRVLEESPGSELNSMFLPQPHEGDAGGDSDGDERRGLPAAGMGGARGGYGAWEDRDRWRRSRSEGEEEGERLRFDSPRKRGPGGVRPVAGGQQYRRKTDIGLPVREGRPGGLAGRRSSDPPPLAYNETVRKKEERRKLHGTTCACCQDYAFKTFIDPSVLPDPNAPGLNLPRTVDERLQQLSKHRQTFVRSGTPEGYWDMDFPSTQQLEERNGRRR